MESDICKLSNIVKMDITIVKIITLFFALTLSWTSNGISIPSSQLQLIIVPISQSINQYTTIPLNSCLNFALLAATKISFNGVVTNMQTGSIGRYAWTNLIILLYSVLQYTIPYYVIFYNT